MVEVKQPITSVLFLLRLLVSFYDACKQARKTE